MEFIAENWKIFALLPCIFIALTGVGFVWLMEDRTRPNDEAPGMLMMVICFVLACITSIPLVVFTIHHMMTHVA